MAFHGKLPVLSKSQLMEPSVARTSAASASSIPTAQASSGFDEPHSSNQAGQRLHSSASAVTHSRVWQQLPQTNRYKTRFAKFSNLYGENGPMYSTYSPSNLTTLIASIRNGEVDLLQEELKQREIDVNEPLNERYALHYAADHGRYAMIEFLLANGADINCVDSYGVTPLLVCIWEGHTDCVRLLLAHGACADGLTPDSKSYYDVADKEAIKLLLRPPAPDSDDEYDESDLMQQEL